MKTWVAELGPDDSILLVREHKHGYMMHKNGSAPWRLIYIPDSEFPNPRIATNAPDELGAYRNVMEFLGNEKAGNPVDNGTR